MRLIRNTIAVLSIFLLACHGQKEKQESELESKPIIESSTETKTTSNVFIDYSEAVALFAQEVLGENIRIHVFDVSALEGPKCLEVFKSNGLEKIVAYSNKTYPKNTAPNYYEHFTVFTATYNSSENAKNNFEQLKSDSKYGLTDLKNIHGTLAERVKLLTIGAKPGGMIIQKGKQLFSLVETCRNPPHGDNWTAYENKFISYITAQDEEIEVLNADCGTDRYYLEKRKN